MHDAPIPGTAKGVNPDERDVLLFHLEVYQFGENYLDGAPQKSALTAIEYALEGMETFPEDVNKVDEAFTAVCEIEDAPVDPKWVGLQADFYFWAVRHNVGAKEFESFDEMVHETPKAIDLIHRMQEYMANKAEKLEVT